MNPKTFLLSIAATLTVAAPSLASDNIADAIQMNAVTAHAGSDGPHIPEPLVFDLVRPLGARRGEIEVNTLGIVPLNRRLGTTSRTSNDKLGQVPLSENTSDVEWAPEIEFALWDGFAVEFEFPFEGARLEALKMGVQWTLGTAFEHRYIHGFQGLVERTLHSTTTSWTGLYLAGMRFNPKWSLLGMWGMSHETGAGMEEEGGDRTQFLQNVTLFYNITDSVHLGLETNYGLSTYGDSILLLMPQLQFGLGKNLSVQLGGGVGFSESETLPQVALRVIWSN